MAIEAKAKVQVQGGSEALKTIQGIQRATKQAGNEATKAAREQERAATKAAREQQKVSREAERLAKNAAKATDKSAKEAANAAKRQADAQIREAKRADKEVQRIQEAETRRWRRLAEDSRRVREQAEQRTERTRSRYASNALRSGVRFVGAATAGVLAGGAVAAGTARGIAGQADVGERIRRANSFQQSLIITGTQAGVSKEKRAEIQSRVLSAAENSGIDPLELAGSLEVAQKSFNGFEKFAGIINELAVTSAASGANVEDLTSALGYIAQANNLTSAEDMVEALNLIVAAAAKGSVEVDNFARDFAASAGIYATNTKQTGIAGVRSFLGVSQGVATGGFGSAESATRVERLAADLQDKNVIKGLSGPGGLGIKLFGDDGKIDVGSVIDQLSTNKKFQKASVRQGIFKEVRSLQAVEALMAARNRVQGGNDPNAVDFNAIAGVQASAGADLTKATFRELEGSGALEMQREAIRMQNDTIENLKAYNAQILGVLKVSNDLEKALGTLSVWASSIGAAGAGAAGAALFGGLGSAGAASAAGGTAVAGGAAAAGGAGLLAMGAGAIGAGAAGYFGAKALGADAAGEGIGNFFADMAFGDRNDVLKGRSGVDFGKLSRPRPAAAGGGAASGEKAAAPVVNELRTQNKLLKQLVEQGERRPAPAVNQPARGPR